MAVSSSSENDDDDDECSLLLLPPARRKDDVEEDEDDPEEKDEVGDTDEGAVRPRLRVAMRMEPRMRDGLNLLPPAAA